MSTIEIELKRKDRTYAPHDRIQGQVIVHAVNGFSHQGIKLTLKGGITFHNPSFASDDHTPGLFDAFHYPQERQRPPIEMVHQVLQVSGNETEVRAGRTSYPFALEFIREKALLGIENENKLFETYHGASFSIQYTLQVECPRGLMKRTLDHELELIVQLPTSSSAPHDSAPAMFKLAQNEYRVVGQVNETNCCISKPLTGHVMVEHSDLAITSIDIQLIRRERIGKFEPRETEIQTIQIANGNVCRKLNIPMYMFWPRLFVSSSIHTAEFQVNFELHVVVSFDNRPEATVIEKIPIAFYR